jgi:hypothetical protein
MNLADVLPTIHQLSPQEKKVLIEQLQTDLAISPPPLAEFLETRGQKALAWDLSDDAVESKNTATLTLLNKWTTEGNEQEQTETWMFLQAALDEPS